MAQEKQKAPPPKTMGNYDPIAVVGQQRDTMLAGKDGKTPLTMDSFQKILAQAQSDNLTYKTFFNNLCSMFGEESVYTVLSIGRNGKAPAPMSGDDAKDLSDFGKDFSNGLKLMNDPHLSVLTTTRIENASFGKDNDLDKGKTAASARDAAAKLYNKMLDVQDKGALEKKVITDDAIPTLRAMGLSDNEIRLVGVVSATYSALQKNQHSSYDGVLEKKGKITFADVENYTKAYLALKGNATSTEDLLKNIDKNPHVWLLETIRQYGIKNEIAPGTMFDSFNAVSNESGPTTDFAAAGKEMTTAPAATDPAAPAPAVAVRRPAAAHDAVPA